MPYIEQKDRTFLDPVIDDLSFKIKRQSDHTKWPGKLNYTITRLILQVVPEMRYWTLAMVFGVLFTLALELYRRVAAPYEDKQKEKNGDVY